MYLLYLLDRIYMHPTSDIHLGFIDYEYNYRGRRLYTKVLNQNADYNGYLFNTRIPILFYIIH